MSEEREAFEAWALGGGLPVEHAANINYFYPEAFKIWQAARQSAGAPGRVPVGYKIAPIEPIEEMIDAACDIDPVEAIKADNLRKGYKTAFATNGQIFAARYKAAIDAAPIVDNRVEFEAEQRRKMQEHLAQRPQTPATADFDLPALNDAISDTRVKDCESCERCGYPCKCAQPVERKRVELTDAEIWQVVHDIKVREWSLIKFARDVIARAQAKEE